MFLSLEELAQARLGFSKRSCYDLVDRVTEIFREEILPHYPTLGQPRYENRLHKIQTPQGIQYVSQRVIVHSTIGSVILKDVMDILHTMPEKHQKITVEVAERYYWYYRLNKIEKNPTIWLTSKFPFPRNYARVYLRQKQLLKEKRRKKLKSILLFPFQLISFIKIFFK